jgi:hypothetical protein
MARSKTSRPPATVDIVYDTKDRSNQGWSFLDGGDDLPTRLDGQAAAAVSRIIDGQEAQGGDFEALRKAIRYTAGDTVSITPVGGAPLVVSDLL